MKVPDDEDLERLVPGDRLTDAERQFLITQYDNAGETRNTDVMIRWYISAVMFPLNSALLLFALPAAFRGEITALFIGAAELIFIHRWYQLEMRMQGLIQYWISKLIEIEDFLRPRIRVFGGEEYDSNVIGVRLTTHEILLRMIFTFALLGAAIIVLFFTSATPKTYSPETQTSSAIEERLERSIEELKTTMDQMEQRIEQLEQESILLPQPEKENENEDKAIFTRRHAGFTLQFSRL